MSRHRCRYFPRMPCRLDVQPHTLNVFLHGKAVGCKQCLSDGEIDFMLSRLPCQGCFCISALKPRLKYRLKTKYRLAVSCRLSLSSHLEVIRGHHSAHLLQHLNYRLPYASAVKRFFPAGPQLSQDSRHVGVSEHLPRGRRLPARHQQRGACATTKKTRWENIKTPGRETCVLFIAYQHP